MKILILTITLGIFATTCFAELTKSQSELSKLELVKDRVTYLGNEAIMVRAGENKVLFDPFFHNVFSTYQLVPTKIVDALMSATAPYDNIDLIFISHAHGDHFSAGDLLSFLQKHKNSELVAPGQAVAQLAELDGFKQIKDQITSIELEYQDPPTSLSAGGIEFDVVRIPHAGWPQRAEVANLVYRVELAKGATIIHMGDADPNDSHFKPLITHWQSKHTDAAFPPYWFLSNASGQMILSERIQADENIGIHVPVAVPRGLRRSGAKYFSNPGEVYNFPPE